MRQIKPEHIAVTVAAIFGGWYLYDRARAAGKIIAKKVNPASRENILYQATGEVGTSIPDWFGGLFKSKAERAVDEMLKQRGPLPPASTTTSSALENVGEGERGNSWDFYGP